MSGTEQLPLVDLRAAQAEIADEIMPEIEEVLRTAGFIGGPRVAAFEDAFAAFIGVQHCVGVANGTDALELGMRAIGISVGDEVILPTNSFIATAEAVSRIGAVPVLVDVDPTHLLMDPDAVAAAIGPRTAAIVPVHLFGQMAPMVELQDLAAKHGVALVEDAAQAQGAAGPAGRAGTVGVVAGTSFYPGKNLGAAGDAGAVLTGDADIARSVRRLAAHGSEKRYEHTDIGVNSRLDALQAVVLSAKLRVLGEWNDRRVTAAHRYASLLEGFDSVTVPRTRPGNEDVWHLYVVQVDHRDEVVTSMNRDGIGAAVHYPTPIHLTSAYAELGLGVGAFPVAETAARRILSLPIHPHLDEAKQGRVVDCLARAIQSVR